jgi:hypothetical protein
MTYPSLPSLPVLEEGERIGKRHGGERKRYPCLSLNLQQDFLEALYLIFGI